MGGVAGEAEEQAWRLLAVHPWRVRFEHGEAIVAAALRGVPPGTDRLPWRVWCTLVRDGLRERWGRRLPLRAHLAYAVGRRLDDRHLPWVVDDIEAPGFGRRAATRWLPLALLATVVVGVLTGRWDIAAALTVLAGVATTIDAPTRRYQIAVRHGLAPPSLDRGGEGEWVLGPERSPLPNLPVARLLVAVAVPAGLAGAAALVAAARPVEIPALDEPSFSAEPVGVGLLGAAALAPAVIGTCCGVLLATNTTVLARRARAVPERRVTHRLTTTVLAGVIALLVAVVLGYGAVMVLARLLPWEAGTVGAALVPVAAGLMVGAGALGRVGRRRGRPVGLWELAPRFAPRRRPVLIARGTIGLLRGAEPLPSGPFPVGPDPGARPGE